jgi:hypothetical protein
MKKILAVILALLVCISVAFPHAFAQEVVATPKFGVKRFETAFAQRYPQTIIVLAADFPQDYHLLSARIAQIGASRATDKDKLAAAFMALAELRRKYANQVVNAPDASLKRVVGLLGEFHLQVLKQEGPKVCGEFAVKGSGALFQANLASRYAARLDAQSAAYFSAVVQSIENPTFHEPVKPSDWTSVSKALVSLGGSLDDIKRIAANDANDSLHCNSLASFLLFIAQLGSPESERMRADFVHNVSGY